MTRARRTQRRGLAAATSACFVFALTACGASVTTEPETRGPSTPAPSPSATASPSDGGSPSIGPGGSTPSKNPRATPDEGEFNVELHITVTPEEGAESTEYVLQCDGTTPSGASNVPNPKEACALVKDSAQALFFTKPDPTMACTQQYGGPQTATVTGTVNGRPVEAHFARTDGCEISRWNTMEPILGTGGAM